MSGKAPSGEAPSGKAARGAGKAEAPPLDLRLTGPAAVVWAVTALLLCLHGSHTDAMFVGAGGFAFGAALLLRRVRWRSAGALLLSAAAACLSTGLAGVALHRGPVAELARTGLPAEVRLLVNTDPHTRDDDGSTALRAAVVRVGGTSTHSPVAVVVRGPHAGAWLGLLPSTEVSVTARARPPGPNATPDLVATLLTTDQPRVLGPPNAVERAAGSLRAGLRRAVAPLDPDERALLPGLVDGDSSAMTADLDDVFSATDLGHLVAVSGSNLSILMVLLIGRASRARTPERGGLAARLGLRLRVGAVGGVLLICGFVVLSRPEPSVLRASATGLVMLLGLATGRRAAPLPALSGATLLLILADPALALSYGFALSALATAGLITVGPRWTAAFHRHGVPERFAEPLGAAAAVQAWIGPLLVLRAARISLVSIPCNLLAELCVAPATVLGFAALAAAPVSLTLAQWIARVAGLPAAALIALARFGASLPGAEIAWPGGWWGAMLLVGVTCALVAAATVLRHPVVAGVLALALVLALLRPAPLTRFATGWPPEGWRLVACDVGQGDALVLSSGEEPSTALLVDAGPDPHAVDACLRSLDVTTLSLVILTHDHADHVEGLPGVLRDRRVGAIETTTVDDPPAEYARVRRWAAANGVPVLHASRGESRSLGRLSWQVLWPEAGRLPPHGPNNASVALLVTLALGDPGSHLPPLRIALLGDLEPPAQQLLLADLSAYPQLRGVDVLKVAHHGSAKQDPALLAALHPRLALISVGADNTYGHPAPSTLHLLHAFGATVLRTDVSGDLAVLDSSGQLAVAVRKE
ncbi:ComEC/Rec2 family competence protein [Streptacidiphilus fuscans]|uniref:ComEC/Rec2 family competence protein n=1 Tax=Streptacidiphilus fuscans TaxID=2789292 RepID=A0A931B344_9ACTN|nr:ComEC/Rec2 family competence protein [Streptacidiphilus fuscans]MBF9070330.1 ComEC/Rec2 family competence protein [Streptacidiphilus fuscans]